MKYDFTSLIDRHGMDAIAVDSWGEIPGMAPNAPDEGFDRIPMWVADMNFATVPTVQEYIIQRAQHPMFGYFNPRDEYFDRIIEWQTRRNGVEGLLPEHIGYENGVLGGVVSTLRAYVQPGDAVLVHSPTYIGFTKSIEAAGYRIVHSPLKLDDRSIESKISDSDRTTALQAMGYPVVLMTYGQLADFDAFRVVMELIMSYLDVPLKDKTPRQQELERRLREEIFIDWAGM